MCTSSREEDKTTRAAPNHLLLLPEGMSQKCPWRDPRGPKLKMCMMVLGSPSPRHFLGGRNLRCRKHRKKETQTEKARKLPGQYVPGASEGQGAKCRCAAHGLEEGVLWCLCGTGNLHTIAMRHSWLMCVCVCVGEGAPGVGGRAPDTVSCALGVRPQVLGRRTCHFSGG